MLAHLRVAGAAARRRRQPARRWRSRRRPWPLCRDRGVSRPCGQVAYGLTASAVAAGRRHRAARLAAVRARAAARSPARQAAAAAARRDDGLPRRPRSVVARLALSWPRWTGCGSASASRWRRAVALAAGRPASWRIGLIVSGGFVAVAIVLYLAGAALVRAVRPLRRVAWFPLRHAVMRVRPARATRRASSCSRSASAASSSSACAARGQPAARFSFDLRPDAPDMFLIDIQQDQRDGVAALLAAGGQRSGAAPGAGAARPRRRRPGPRRQPRRRSRRCARSGSIVARVRRHLAADARAQRADRRWPVLVDGASGSPSEVGGGLDRVGLCARAPACSVGDRMRFDVLGRIVEARVTSVRARRLGRFRDRAGSCSSSAPACSSGRRTPISPSCARRRTRRRGRGCSATWCAAFANVSVIDVREVVQTVQGVLRNVTLAISVVGGIALFCGLLILIGAVAMTKFQRLQEVGPAQDARCQQPHRGGDAGHRVRRPRAARRHHWRAWRHGSELRRSRAASSTCPGKPRPRTPSAASSRPRCWWRSSVCCQPGRAAAQAAGGAAGRLRPRWARLAGPRAALRRPPPC